MRNNTVILISALSSAAMFVNGSSFGALIGPGDQTAVNNDSGPDLIAVDTSNSKSLIAGTYSANTFNYQFTATNNRSLDGVPAHNLPLGGTITPMLLYNEGGNYKPLVIGSAISYSADTAFRSVAFNNFTLGATTTVYAGVYWDGTYTVNAMPVGFTSGGGAFVRYNGASAPVVNSTIGGGSALSLSRLYDFSITAEQNFARLVASSSSGGAQSATLTVNGTPGTQSYQIAQTTGALPLNGHIGVQGSLAADNSSPNYVPVYVLLDFKSGANDISNTELTAVVNQLVSLGFVSGSTIGSKGQAGYANVDLNDVLAAYAYSGDYDIVLKFNSRAASTGNPLEFDFEYNFGNIAGATGITLNQIGIVPEPSSIAMIGLGALGVFASRRRRK